MKPCSKLHNQRGFTIVEMLIAMLIMTVGVIATLSLISTSMNANTRSNQLTTKTALAQQAMEGLLSAPINTLPELTTTTTVDTVRQMYDPKDKVMKDFVKIEGAGTFKSTFTTAVDTLVINGKTIKNVTLIKLIVESVNPDGTQLVPRDPTFVRTSAYRCVE